MPKKKKVQKEITDDAPEDALFEKAKDEKAAKGVILPPDEEKEIDVDLVLPDEADLSDEEDDEESAESELDTEDVNPFGDRWEE